MNATSPRPNADIDRLDRFEIPLLVHFAPFWSFETRSTEKSFSMPVAERVIISFRISSGTQVSSSFLAAKADGSWPAAGELGTVGDVNDRHGIGLAFLVHPTVALVVRHLELVKSRSTIFIKPIPNNSQEC